MLRRIFSLMAVVMLVAACSSTPDSSGSAEDALLTPPEQREPLTDSDVLFEDTGEGVSATDGDMMSVPGTQEDLIVSVGDRVFYATDSSELDATARKTLERQAAWLRTYPNVNVVIEGHADERGTREYNLALGERRANSAKNYLVALGIDGGRIETISYGKERPAVLGSNPAAWKRNRRAVMVVQ